MTIKSMKPMKPFDFDISKYPPLPRLPGAWVQVSVSSPSAVASRGMSNSIGRSSFRMSGWTSYLSPATSFTCAPGCSMP